MEGIVENLDKRLDTMIKVITKKADSVSVMSVLELEKLDDEIRTVMRVIKSAKALIKMVTPSKLKNFLVSVKNLAVKAIKTLMNKIKALINRITKKE